MNYAATPSSELIRDDPSTANNESIEANQTLQVDSEDTVIVVSFKLPIQVVKMPNGGFKIESAKSILNTTLYNLQQKNANMKTVWIGWPGVTPDSDEEQAEIEKSLRQCHFDCIPIFPDTETIENFLRFHETVIRPLFHNFKALKDFEFDKDMKGLWGVYQSLNN
jgi:trehalose-6-phosphate synthase